MRQCGMGNIQNGMWNEVVQSWGHTPPLYLSWSATPPTRTCAYRRFWCCAKKALCFVYTWKSKPFWPIKLPCTYLHCLLLPKHRDLGTCHCPQSPLPSPPQMRTWCLSGQFPGLGTVTWWRVEHSFGEVWKVIRSCILCLRYNTVPIALTWNLCIKGRLHNGSWSYDQYTTN